MTGRRDIYFILLAAGDSRRFGSNKLLCPFQGKPMYRYMADAVDQLPPDLLAGKVVVTQYAEIGRELERRKYHVIDNKASRNGISYSIRLALEYLETLCLAGTEKSSSRAYCFAVCDQPYLTASTLAEFLCGWRVSGKGLGCLGYHGALGNPAVFSDSYREELMALEGDTGGKRVIRRYPQDRYVCEVEDPWELVDMDEKIMTRERNSADDKIGENQRHEPGKCHAGGEKPDEQLGEDGQPLG